MVVVVVVSLGIKNVRLDVYVYMDRSRGFTSLFLKELANFGTFGGSDEEKCPQIGMFGKKISLESGELKNALRPDFGATKL